SRRTTIQRQPLVRSKRKPTDLSSRRPIASILGLRYRRIMSSSSTSMEVSDVPTQVFEKFLEALAEAQLPADLVVRLRMTLIEDKSFTDAALTAAVLPSDPVP